MDFDFSPEERAFAEEVEQFLDANDDPDVFDVTRENMAQIVDTPARRAFMKKLADRGWLGMTWPKAYGGQDGEGVYEFLLNEALAGRGGPQIGKGVGIIGKTLIRVGSDDLKAEFLPKILDAEVEFAVGYSEPDAGSDAASMKLKATRSNATAPRAGSSTGRRRGRPPRTSPSGTGSAPAPTPTRRSTRGITLFLVPLDDPGITINGIWTMGDERTNDVFFDDVFVPDVHVVGEVNSGFQYISSALDLERFTMFTFSPMRQRLDVLCDYVRDTRDRRRAAEGRSDRAVQDRAARDARPRCHACSGCAVVDASVKSEDERRCAADDRVVRRTSSTRPSSRAGSRTPRWTSAGPARSCGCVPRKRRWRGGRNRRTATR